MIEFPDTQIAFLYLIFAISAISALFYAVIRYRNYEHATTIIAIIPWLLIGLNYNTYNIAMYLWIISR
jgi:hypothetical protein